MLELWDLLKTNTPICSSLLCRVKKIKELFLPRIFLTKLEVKPAICMVIFHLQLDGCQAASCW